MCASNQGVFYGRFAAVVLLTVPVDVLLQRLAARTTNDFGREPAERERIQADLRDVEPLLRVTSTKVVDANRPLGDVAGEVEGFATST